MALGNPSQLETEVMQMLWKLGAESLQCAYRIIELDVPESKKGNQNLLLKNFVRHVNIKEVEAREDGDLYFVQKLRGFLSKHFKTPEKTKGEPLVNEQGFFVDVKQPFYSAEIINGTKEHQTKTENFAHLPQISNEMDLILLKTLLILMTFVQYSVYNYPACLRWCDYVCAYKYRTMI